MIKMENHSKWLKHLNHKYKAPSLSANPLQRFMPIHSTIKGEALEERDSKAKKNILKKDIHHIHHWLKPLQDV
ncbi:unnamed protein product [Cochlearia groenlandica]